MISIRLFEPKCCHPVEWWCSHQVVSDSCGPMDCSPPGSSIHGIFQARILGWTAIPFPMSLFLTASWDCSWELLALLSQPHPHLASEALGFAPTSSLSTCPSSPALPSFPGFLPCAPNDTYIYIQLTRDSVSWTSKVCVSPLLSKSHTLYTAISLNTGSHMHTRNNTLQPRAQLFLVLPVSMSPWLSAEVASPHLAFNETHSTDTHRRRTPRTKCGWRPPSSQPEWKAGALSPRGKVTLVTCFFWEQERAQHSFWMLLSLQESQGHQGRSIVARDTKILYNKVQDGTTRETHYQMQDYFTYLCSEGILAFSHHQLKLNSCSETTFQYGQLLLLEILKW